jgi:bifunctional DNA-binding transcriptional regulator/antitoxin component of YhaV-PrlF toxin-antitoxin module
MTINTYPIKIRQRGQLTIPQPVREKWSTQNGDMMTLVLFDEFAILAPTNLKTPSLARQFSQIMDEEGVSLVDLLEGLQEERKKL